MWDDATRGIVSTPTCDIYVV